MAAFVSRDPADRDVFFAHWRRILSDPTVTMKVIAWEGRVCGIVGSYLLDGKPQVTYWIGREFWGKGIATRGLTKFLATFGTHPLYASAARDNVASIRVLEKCGFVRCGSGRAFAEARGEEIEEVFFELTP